MGDGPQAGEETAVPHLLKVALAHILTTHYKNDSEGSLVVFQSFILHSAISYFIFKEPFFLRVK